MAIKNVFLRLKETVYKGDYFEVEEIVVSRDKILDDKTVYNLSGSDRFVSALVGTNRKEAKEILKNGGGATGFIFQRH